MLLFCRYLQELDNEVHQDGVPVLLWDLRWVKLSVWQPLECLSPDAWLAGANVLADVPGQLGPPVALGDELQHLEAASMSGHPSVVVLHHDPPLEVLVLQDNNLVVKLEKSIGDLQADLQVLEELLGDKCHRKIQLSCESPSDIAKEGNLGSGHHTPSNAWTWNSSG
jgi:hypothetical protein